ncbi:hypothetical protein Tco_0967486 [Tanacetum coccineum]
MANLDFCDKHNMVAYLQKSEGSEGFHQIIDFLSTTHIKFALTKSLTIYVSLIEQFWQTASASTPKNGEMEITATSDGNVKVVYEASIRIHLQLEDSDRISTLPNAEIFEQLALIGQNVQGEGSTIPVESHHTSTSALSTSQPPTSSPSMQTTHAALMPHDSPIPIVHSLGSDEGSLTLNELMILLKKLEKTVKTSQARRRAKIIVSDDEEDEEDVTPPFWHDKLQILIAGCFPWLGASCIQRKVSMVLFVLPSIMLLVVIVVTVVIVVVILVVVVVAIVGVVIVVVIIGVVVVVTIIGVVVVVVVDLTGDEDLINEDGDIGMGDSTGVSASLGGEISSGGKKNLENQTLVKGKSLIEDMDLDAGISLVTPHVADRVEFDELHITAGMASVSTASGLVSTAGMAQEVEINIPSLVATKDKGKAVMQESEPPKKIKKRVSNTNKY